MWLELGGGSTLTGASSCLSVPQFWFSGFLVESFEEAITSQGTEMFWAHENLLCLTFRRIANILLNPQMAAAHRIAAGMSAP